MFKIALTQVIFDNSYNNVLRFSSLAEQKAYFNLDTLFSKSPNVNYPFGTFYVTRVPIRIDESKQSEALSYNYAIVKDLSQTDVYYFYFVKNASYDAGNTQMICDLELDIFNTYYISTTFTPCLVNRAHFDRWGEIVNGKVSFNNNVNSLLFEQEEIQTKAKYLKSREEIDFIDVISNTNVKNIIKEKVKGWAYMFLDANILTSNDVTVWVDSDRVRRTKIENIGQDYVTLVFPVCDDNVFEVSTYDNNTTYKPWYYDCMSMGQSLHPSNYIISQFAPFILDVIISQQPPIELFTTDNYEISVVNNKIRIKYLTSNYGDTKNDYFSSVSFLTLGTWLSDTYFACVHMQKYTLNRNNVIDKQLSFDFTFDVSDIISDTHNINYNPKILSEPYTQLKLGYASSEPQIYDILKLGKNFKCKWLNNIEPSILKSYIGLYNSTDVNTIYNEKTFKSFIGCKMSIDASLPYAIDQMKSYLAQNKNFYQIAKNNYGIGVAGAIQRGVGSAILGSLSSKNAMAKVLPPLALASAGIDLLQTQKNYENAMLTIDNMDNAPETFKNIDNSVFLNLNINGTKPYIEIWQNLPIELIIADNDMNKNGYTYNQIDNVKNVDNIRHYWNFVQAQLENIVSTKIMSNVVREKFKEVFSRGVRFWNITDLVTNNTFDFNTHENYERRLNNEL